MVLGAAKRFHLSHGHDSVTMGILGLPFRASAAGYSAFKNTIYQWRKLIYLMED